MIRAFFQFPRGFLWGTATSSHQVEGGNTNNDWWAWEQEPGHIHHDHVSGAACDWWGGRWAEDFDRAAEYGQNAHRLSLEWSRIEPSPALWDEAALEQYREMIEGMLARGLMPMVTLHHFTNPQWVAEKGGWANPEIVSLFARYTRKVITALEDVVGLWVTINEPNVLAVGGFLQGIWPPGVRDLRILPEVYRNLILAHAAAYHVIHEIQPGALVGLAHHYRGFHPANPRNPAHRWIAQRKANAFNHVVPHALREGRMRFLHWHARVPEAVGTQDFFGLNYYTVESTSFNILQPMSSIDESAYPDGADLSPSGFIANEPEGLWEALTWARRSGLPIYITENGIDDGESAIRPRYLAQHVHQVWQAVNFNWPVRGYFHWSLVDNFEWERGWSQRFGLWSLNENTQERRPRMGADLFREICHANGLSSEMVALYAPNILNDLFPPRGAIELAPEAN
jgi:beta-glucosidase